MADKKVKILMMDSTTHILVEWHWEEVQGPLVVCIWVLIAGIAKIGFHEAHRLRSAKNLYPKLIKFS